MDFTSMKPNASSQAATCLCWGSLPSLEFDELASVAGHNGYREISITAGHYQRARARGHSDVELQRMLARNGVRVGVIDPLIGPLPGTPAAQEVRPEWRHFFEYQYVDCLTAAIAVDARTINVAHFLGDPKTPLDHLAETISEIAHKAEASGLQISVEFIPGTGISDFERACEIVARVRGPNVGIMLDTWHFARSGGTLDQLKGIAGSSVIEVQLSDLRQTNSDQPYKPMTGRLPPGEGELPLLEIARALEAHGRQMVYGVEVFTDETGDAQSVAASLARATARLLGASLAVKK